LARCFLLPSGQQGSIQGHKLPVAERTVSAGRYPSIIEHGGLGAAFKLLTLAV
jgi:hypothetical protein